MGDDEVKEPTDQVLDTVSSWVPSYSGLKVMTEKDKHTAQDLISLLSPNQS